MNNQSFVLYESAYKQFETIKKRLGKEAACDLIDDIMQYGLYGVLPEEESNSWLYGFEQIITSISKAKDRYAAAVENGKKGGRPQKVDINKVVELKEKGLTNSEVAKELKCSESTVEKKMAEYRKNQKNLNDNVNDNDNDNAASALANARLESGEPRHPTTGPLFRF